MTMLIGKVLLKRYEVIEEIARGGFGHTYITIDLAYPGNPRQVLKHLCPKHQDRRTLKAAKRLFEDEAYQLAELGKKNEEIPELHSYFEEEGEFYLVQELIEGENLVEEFQQGKKWSETETVAFVRELLEILSIVHQHDTIHCDIKPANIMRRQQDGRLVLIDFGAVKKKVIDPNEELENPSDPSSMIVGTPPYMAPERGWVSDKCSDIFAVGMLGIQALTGLSSRELSYYCDSEQLEKVWQEHNVKASSHLKSVLARMISYQYKNRYADAIAALDALNNIAIESQPTQKITFPNKRTNRSTPVKLLLACVGVGIVSTGIYKIISGSQKVNYARLETHLQNQRWEEANAETDKLILNAAGESNALDVQSARNISCESLRKIDKLWRSNSDERYGYTPQLEAYLATGNRFDQYNEGNYEAFGNRVGWRIFDFWKPYQEYNFTALATLGQFPTPGRKAADRQDLRTREPEILLSRFYTCQSLSHLSDREESIAVRDEARSKTRLIR